MTGFGCLQRRYKSIFMVQWTNRAPLRQWSSKRTHFVDWVGVCMHTKCALKSSGYKPYNIGGRSRRGVGIKLKARLSCKSEFYCKHVRFGLKRNENKM